jgi:DNA-binding Lrp family transcriptional regulator
MPFSVIDLLQSSGPIALNELSMRLSQAPEELVRELEELRKARVIDVSGPKSGELLTNLSPEEIGLSSDTIIELSRRGLRRSFAG